jgi:hypothetical protein
MIDFLTDQVIKSASTTAEVEAIHWLLRKKLEDNLDDPTIGLAVLQAYRRHEFFLKETENFKEHLTYLLRHF